MSPKTQTDSAARGVAAAAIGLGIQSVLFLTLFYGIGIRVPKDSYQLTGIMLVLNGGVSGLLWALPWALWTRKSRPHFSMGLAAAMAGAALVNGICLASFAR